MYSMFIALLSLRISLACESTRSLRLNDEPCVVRTTLIDINSVELKYFPFMWFI